MSEAIRKKAHERKLKDLKWGQNGIDKVKAGIEPNIRKFIRSIKMSEAIRKKGTDVKKHTRKK